MKIIDAYLLARTKRKTRRIRTALVTIVSSLLFSVLFFAVIVAAGVMQSAAAVKDVGYNSRYLTGVLPFINAAKVDFQATEANIKATMDAELRARKITVNDDTRKLPEYQQELSARITKVLTDNANIAAQEFEVKLKGMGKQSALYGFERTDLEQRLVYEPDPTKDSKAEQLKKQQTAQPSEAEESRNGNQQVFQEYFMVDKDMMRTQLLPGQSFDWQPGQPVPVMITYDQLEKLSGRSFTNINAALKNQGYKQLIADYNGKVIDFCYRNSTAAQQLQDVVRHNYLVTNDTDKTTNPIDVPVCAGFDQALLKKIGLITQPSATDPQPLFKAAPAPAPQTAKMQFKVVALTPGQSQFGSSDILEGLLGSVGAVPFVGSSVFIPSHVVAHNQLLQPELGGNYHLQTMYIADFANRSDQKDFLALGCSGNECAAGNKPYMIPFGNMGVALEGVFEVAFTGLLIAGGATMAIAALMIFFTISKVIADSTKEIAVFRALGARRRDIVQIYLTYGGMLTVSALLFALLLGTALAYSAHVLLNDQFAAMLIQSVGAYNHSPHISLVGFQPLWLLVVISALIIAAAIGVSLPTLAAAHRKLITILREE